MPAGTIPTTRTEAIELWSQLQPALRESLSRASADVIRQVRSAIIARWNGSERGELGNRLTSEELVQACMPRILPDLQQPDAKASRFWQRLVNDQAREKEKLAEYAARRYIREGYRCFVQASTTALYLGRHIAGITAKSTLLYTNSVIFPMTVLSQSNFHSVFTFCGSIYDAMCGGWLFELGDEGTKHQLRDLFRRDKDRLTAAFLMPLAIRDHEIYFPRRETALLASILLEEAEELVILSPANRIVGIGDQPQTDLDLEPVNPSSFKKRVTLVVCGDRHGRERELQAGLEQNGFDVQWLPSPSSATKPLGIYLADVPEEALDAEIRGFRSQFESPCPELGAGSTVDQVDDEQMFRLLIGALTEAMDKQGTDWTLTRKFFFDVFELGTIFKAFRKAPNQTISGKDGVAEQLKLSRNALYVRLRELDLRAQDLFDPEATLYGLILRSKPMRAMAEQFLGTKRKTA